jgi:F-type H+-transporting ATPase subunit b
VRQARTRSPKVGSLMLASGLALVAAPAHAAGDLVLFPDPIWLVVLMATFAFLVYPMNALLFKPIFRVLDERKERIDGARRRAAQLQSEADEMLSRYRASVQSAREETDRERRRELEAARAESATSAGAARAEADGIIERGRTDLNGWLAGARADLRSSVDPLAQVAAERVLGRSLN